MLRHAGCNGLLTKRKGSKWYRCSSCKDRVIIGTYRPGVNTVKPRTAGVRTYYEVAKASEGSECMSLHSLIAGGGKVLIAGSKNKAWDAYRSHPQLVFWSGDASEISRHLKNGNNLPDNTKAVVISRFIGHAEAGKIIEEARRKRALIMMDKNDGQVTEILSEITRGPGPIKTPEPFPLPPVPKSIVQPQLRLAGRNWLTEFITHHHRPEGNNAEEGRRIYDIIEKAGGKSTPESVKTAVGALRRKLGIAIGPRAQTEAAKRAAKADAVPVYDMTVSSTFKPPTSEEIKRVLATPPTAAPVDEVGAILGMVDDLMAGFSLLKEKLSKLHHDSVEYAKLKAKLKDLIG